jgi:hypothetical protein
MNPSEQRQAIEQSQEVLGVRRWNSLTVEQRKELVEAIKSGMPDKELFQIYKRISVRELETLCTQR